MTCLLYDRDMNGLHMFGERQQVLLKALLHQPAGLTADRLAEHLEISRNAVTQHLAALQAGDYVEGRYGAASRGRPSRLYQLTMKGKELFPRHYDMFSNLLVGMVRERIGNEELRACMTMLGKSLAQEFFARVQRESALAGRVKEVSTILTELGYEAEFTAVGPDGEPEIVARNCVFHKLAEKSPEVCQLDLSLISSLLETEVEQRECMVRGGLRCRFGLVSKNNGSTTSM